MLPKSSLTPHPEDLSKDHKGFRFWFRGYHRVVPVVGIHHFNSHLSHVAGNSLPDPRPGAS